jgi:hypothetical protein
MGGSSPRQEQQMAFDVSVALTWILFLALFPMAYFWLRRAWRIGMRRDYSEVALKRGEPPPDVRRWAPFALAINGLAGIVIVCVIAWVVLSGMPYEVWTAIAGSTIWTWVYALSMAVYCTAWTYFGSVGRPPVRGSGSCRSTWGRCWP